MSGSTEGSTSGSHDERGWWTRTVFPTGKEPDPRFTLANERTFLAWTRTALAFLAGGIALEAFGLPGFDADWRRLASITLILVGMAVSLGSAVRWVRIERSLRNDRPLPAPGIVPVLGVGITVACVIVMTALL